jgi:oxygen-dependent protoporphyrinogen oxidase
MRRVAILGAGISGLAAAVRLRERFDVTVYDAANRAGGCIETLHENGFTLEMGPDSLLIDKPWGKDLLERLHLSDAIVEMLAQYKGARIVHNGRLRPIPADFRLFTPTSLAALLAGGIFSPIGLARAALEPFVPRRRSQDDESLASFVTRRFGREVLDRLAQPLIGGIYSADPYRLSMEATLPQFAQMERTHGSLIRAMRAMNAKRASPQLVSLRGGLGSIVDVIARELGGAVRLNARVTSLHRQGEQWLITFADSAQVQADAIVCALPAHVAAHLLREVEPDLADLLGSIRYNSIATVSAAYDAASIPQLPKTTGFVVPYCEGHSITAATIVTQKYPERSPDNAVLLRAFVGGALQPALLQHNDQHLVAIAREEFARLLGISTEPLFARVRRWERLLPEYGVGHVALVREIERRATALPELMLAGSAFHGVGIPDCIHSGERAADRLLGIM